MQVIKEWIKWICLLTLFLNSCIYQYNPDLAKYNDKIAVYGVITNENKPLEIEISRTSSVYGNTSIDETHAKVIISDDTGNSINLEEVAHGKYKTIDNYSGVIGHSYKVNITTSDGKHYESEMVKLIDVPETSAISYEFVSKRDPITNKELEGYQFYINLEGNLSNQKYIRWELDEIWQIRMPYYTNYYFDGVILQRKEYPQNCWRSGKVDEIFLADMKDFRTNSVLKFPLNYTTTETEKLSVKYNLIVKQYSLSDKAYDFWKGLSENTQKQASLYNKQPYQVIGNIRCIDNPDEIVLGIFEASAVTITQIFIERPKVLVPNGFEICKKKDLSSLTRQEQRSPYWAYIDIVGSFAVLDERCIDCTKTGSSTVKPNNWE